jgi:hypothetical protein
LGTDCFDAAKVELTRPEFQRLCRMVHQLTREQMIPAAVSSVWAFFATPANLNALTPPSMHFKLLGEVAPMYAGQMISYRIPLLSGTRVYLIF